MSADRVRPPAQEDRAKTIRREMARVGVAPRLARGILAVVMACIGVVAVIKVIETRLSVAQTALCLVYLLAVIVLQVRVFARQDGAPEPTRPGVLVALAVQGLLAYLPLLEFGQAWVGMPGLFAGSVLLSLPAVPAWALFVGVVLSAGVIQNAIGGSVDAVAYTTVSTVLTGLVIYGLCRLSNLVGLLHRARGEFTRLAIEAERDRVARDLHDLIGYQLSAVALKTELAQRLLEARPDHARTELDESVTMARKALADVRAVARGITLLSLRSEIRSTRSTMDTAGIDVTIVEEGDMDEVEEPIRTLLAVVLREAVTNVLRHSDASTCQVRLAYGPGPVELIVANDGVEPGPVSAESDGRGGLDNLAHRLASVDGTLDAGPRGDGTFQMAARIPVRP